MNKQNKTVLITGASSGIGYELAKVFAGDGYNLVVVARRKQRLDKIASELKKLYGIDTKVIEKDLSKPDSPQGIYDDLKKSSIHVDILVNNAGFSEYGIFTKTDLRKELEVIQVNMTALTHLTKLFLPGMIAKGYGKIMNVASVGAFVPGPINAVYCASKAYVLSFSEAIAEELKGTGVSVTALCPGATRTEFGEVAGVTEVRAFKSGTMIMDPIRVAKVGYKALMKDKTVIVPGIINKTLVSSVRISPRFMAAKFSKILMSSAN